MSMHVSEQRGPRVSTGFVVADRENKVLVRQAVFQLIADYIRANGRLQRDCLPRQLDLYHALNRPVIWKGLSLFEHERITIDLCLNRLRLHLNDFFKACALQILKRVEWLFGLLCHVSVDLRGSIWDAVNTILLLVSGVCQHQHFLATLVSVFGLLVQLQVLLHFERLKTLSRVLLLAFFVRSTGGGLV